MLFFSITLKRPIILGFSFLENWLVLIFFVNKLILSPILLKTFFLCLFAWFDWLICTFAKDFYVYFYIDYITSKISILFFLLICLQIMISKKLITLNLIRVYKFFKIYNKDCLVKTKSLLFVTNPAIDNSSTQLSYW